MRVPVSVRAALARLSPFPAPLRAILVSSQYSCGGCVSATRFMPQANQCAMSVYNRKRRTMRIMFALGIWSR